MASGEQLPVLSSTSSPLLTHHLVHPRPRSDYPELGLEASVKALIDAGITYDQVETAAVGYCYGDSTCGQRALYQLGMTGIPIVNVNNNCSTGSSAFAFAANAIQSGQAECALALGFEKMAAGSLGSAWDDRAQPMEGTMTQLFEIEGDKEYEVVSAAQLKSRNA